MILDKSEPIQLNPAEFCYRICHERWKREEVVMCAHVYYCREHVQTVTDQIGLIFYVFLDNIRIFKEVSGLQIVR